MPCPCVIFRHRAMGPTNNRLMDSFAFDPSELEIGINVALYSAGREIRQCQRAISLTLWPTATLAILSD